MKTKIFRFLLYLIFLFGIYGTGALVIKEFSKGAICPKIFNIPACFIIIICLVVPFIYHLLRRGNIVYFVLTGLACSIAVYGSVFQLLGNVECPKTNEGVPMCYISLTIFTFLILLKILELKIIEKQKRVDI
ncbi:hypothetical protein KO500_06530 [Cellulophaga baltica]|uniref:hypothetical protein n=1 Tax=Cellulophaga TaxID=104264 RepID=UPI001C07DA53|nr:MULTISPECIES: hypothetical protein [Cellulophaga]MBU2996080.1 hypothetical protein [Cellulophaga baltica]MDO6767475.1 hypothetical protein [Cellulophaga sp. 1_MG-2023]